MSAKWYVDTKKRGFRFFVRSFLFVLMFVDFHLNMILIQSELWTKTNTKIELNLKGIKRQLLDFKANKKVKYNKKKKEKNYDREIKLNKKRQIANCTKHKMDIH